MKDMKNRSDAGCEAFLDELELLSPEDGDAAVSAKQLLEKMREPVRQHGLDCASCSEALNDLADTRRALRAVAVNPPQAGPWFTKRVMAAIASKETELEEQENSVWLSVRRLAPRLVALSALLLVLGGTWAMQLRHAELANRPVESWFEGSPGPANDDVLAVVLEEQRP